MKGKLIIKLASIAAAASLLVSGAYAAFTSNSVSITGVVLGSATPNLQIGTDANWGETAYGYEETNLYPGWTGDQTGRLFKLQNNTSENGLVPFAKVIPTISAETYVGSTWDQWKDQVQIRFWENGSGAETGTDWKSLNYWSTNTTSNVLKTDLNNDGSVRSFRYQVRMLADADPALAGENTMTFKINFVGLTP